MPSATSFEPLRILRVLSAHEVEFIVVGGVSAVLHGAPVTTFDLDIVHRRTPENIDRLLAALRELDAILRSRSARPGTSPSCPSCAEHCASAAKSDVGPPGGSPARRELPHERVALAPR